MERLYHGSCHCRAITYQVRLDLADGTTRCNCTYCRKVRNWTAGRDPAKLRIMEGAEGLRGYTLTGAVRHEFCPNCGVRLFSRGEIPGMGPVASVMVSTLDDAAEADLIAAPVRWIDGLHDDWWHEPQEIRHL